MLYVLGEALALCADTVGIMFFCKCDDFHTSGNAHFAFQKPKCMSAKFLCSLKALGLALIEFLICMHGLALHKLASLCICAFTTL